MAGASNHDRSPDSRPLPAPLYGMLCLPGGLVNGFVSVTLGFVLGHRGVSVAAVSGLVGLFLLPTTWMFLAGPVVDVSLTPRRWYAITVIVTAGCFAAFALTPMTAVAVPLLGVLTFTASAAAVGASAAAIAAMALTTSPAERGPIAGWIQAANLGGTGLGGGLGLWVADRAGESAAALAMAATTLACAAPLTFLRVPRRLPGVAVSARAGQMAREIWELARTRAGILAVILMVMPSALGASMGLLPAAAGAWRASASLVALMSGVLGGLATIPGCVVGGHLCRRHVHRSVYIVGALAFAAGLTAMALSPHTPFAYGAFLISNYLILGVALGALTSVNFDALGPTSPATVSSGLLSLANLPLLAMTLLLGQAEARLGVNGMLLTEAGLGAACVALYTLLALCWRAPASAELVAMAR
jgi:MFS family permease